MHWIIFILIAGIFIFAPYQRGLFFDNDLYLLEVLIMISFVTWIVYSFFNKNVKIEPKYYLVFLVPLMYTIAFLFAESPKDNFDNLLRWLTYASFFILLVWLQSYRNLERWLPLVFQSTGIVIAIFSFGGYLGWIEYVNIMLVGRLTGPFQYANALATVMGAYVLYSLFMLTRPHQNKWVFLLFSSPLVIFGVTFLHTYSRGAYVVILVAWFIGLVILKFSQQVVLLTHSLVFVLITFFCFVISLQTDNLGEWGILAALLLLSAFMVSYVYFANMNRMQGLIRRFSEIAVLRQYGKVIMSGSIIILGVLLILDINNEGLLYRILPDTIQSRIGQISLETSSVVARSGMYEDAMQISAGYPLGAGGDGWRILYSIFQTKPYYSNEIHNGYLEILLSIGWVGLLLFVGVFVFFVFHIFKKQKERYKEDRRYTAGLTALLMLALHALIDFDFSYGAIWFIMLWLLAMHVIQDQQDKKQVTNLSNRSMIIFVIIRSSLVILLLVGAIFSLRFHQAHQLAATAREGITAEQGVDLFERAVAKHPYNLNYTVLLNPEYGTNLAGIYLYQYSQTGEGKWKTKIENLIHKAESLEPHNGRLMFTISTIYAQLNELKKSIEYVDRAIQYEKFNVTYYDHAITIKWKLATQLISRGDTDNGVNIMNLALRDYEQYREWVSQESIVSVPDRRPINIKKETELLAARAYLYQERPQIALSILMRYNPSISVGIYDEEKDELNVTSFDFATLEDIINRDKDKIMIMSVRDEATAQLSNSTEEYMESLGFKIKDLEYRGSYVAVVAGGEIIFEGINNEGAITLDSENSPELIEILDRREFNIKSAGLFYGNQSSINIKGKEYSINDRGINIAVFDNNLNHLYSMNFDTHVSNLSIFETQEDR